ncbi:MAG TPA: hypothetical protein VJ036_02110 [bacterium]|nr:hypothetical protein [bacterium]
MDTRNSYGVRDLTPFNAVKQMNNKGAAIYFGGLQFGGLHEYSLRPADVVNECAKLGFKITKKTIQRRREAGLVTQPYYSGGKRGPGANAFYRKDAPAELYASETLIRKLRPWRSIEQVANIRALACTENIEAFWRSVRDCPDNYAAEVWLLFYAKALGLHMPIRTVYWKDYRKEFSPEGEREIRLETFKTGYIDYDPVSDKWRLQDYNQRKEFENKFHFLEVLNPTIIKEADDPETFAEWWKLFHHLEN